MSPTFLLFIAFAVLAASSIPVLAWGLFFSIFSRRRIYGAKTLFIGCLGGLGSLSLILTLGMIFRTSADHTSIKTLIMIFGAGFGLVGGFYAIVGLFSPMFSYNNRWYSRRRSSRL
jgi:Na+(H+)/acetate symporter ActP